MENGEFAQDPRYAHVSQRILELAVFGEVVHFGDAQAARYNLPDDTIETILTEKYNSLGNRCRTIINYVDGTNYQIRWQKGSITQILHDIASAKQPIGEDYVLPHTDHIVRADYVYERPFDPVEEAESLLGLHVVVEPFVSNSSEFIEKAIERLHNPPERLSEVLASLYENAPKDINPDDVDIEALCAPILAIDPVRDRTKLYTTTLEDLFRDVEE